MGKMMINEPIFVKVRNDQGEIYDSYTDFWTLIELSGFATCELNDLGSHKAATYIFAPDNGNVKAALIHLRATHPDGYKSILWQLERPGKIENVIPDYFDEMWVSDRSFAERINDPHCKFVILGGHIALGKPSSPQKKYDFIHLSYLYGERAQKVTQLEQLGYSMAPNGWSNERDEALAVSRYGLCLHQDQEPIIEPLRYTLFSCWGIPIVNETCTDWYPYSCPIDVKTFFNQQVDNGVLALLETSAKMNYKRMTQEYTFRHSILEALHG